MAVRVLIAEDSAFVRTMLKNILTPNGYEVVGEAKNGMDAIKLFKELSPDIVTMDITMPQMDGLTALKEILEIDPAAKVVMCSAAGHQMEVWDATLAGAKDYIVKPFEAERVLDVLGKL